MPILGRTDDGALVEVTLPGDEPGTEEDLHDEDLAELDRRWPPAGLDRIERAPDDTAIDRRMRVTGRTTAAWDRIESELGLFAAERLERLVAVHAALAVVDGRAIVLPGRSFAGKTTLGVALAAAGAVLASDEYTLVDPTDGLVIGWSRPARIRVGVGDSRREPVAAAIPPTPVALVALLRYDATIPVEHPGMDGAEGPVRIRPISRADAVVAILDETVCARSRPDESLDAAIHLSAAEVVTGTRGDAEQAAVWLLERVRSSAGTAGGA
jgi:hypothetical protein